MSSMREKSSRDIRQEQCVTKWIQAKGRGTIVGATGFGLTNLKKF